MQQQQAPASRLATIPEAAAYVRVSVSYFKKLLADGKFTRVRIGGRVFIAYAELDDAIDRQLVAGQRTA